MMNHGEKPIEISLNSVLHRHNTCEQQHYKLSSIGCCKLTTTTIGVAMNDVRLATLTVTERCKLIYINRIK